MSDEARRKFLKKAGQVAVTTPAVTLLMSAGAKGGTLMRPVSILIPGLDDGGSLPGPFDGGGQDGQAL